MILPSAASFKTSRARARSIETVTTEEVESAADGVALGVGDVAGEYMRSGSKAKEFETSERLALLEGKSGDTRVGLKVLMISK